MASENGHWVRGLAMNVQTYLQKMRIIALLSSDTNRHHTKSIEIPSRKASRTKRPRQVATITCTQMKRKHCPRKTKCFGKFWQECVCPAASSGTSLGTRVGQRPLRVSSRSVVGSLSTATQCFRVNKYFANFAVGYGSCTDSTRLLVFYQQTCLIFHVLSVRIFA